MISNETAREALQGLTPQEREYALKILQELEQNGSSKSYEDLMLSEYKEVPVDIITFIKDPQYLGKAWHLPNGQCKLFPFWEEKLKELFPDNISTNYNTFIESGARGLGKAQPLDSPVLTKDGFKRMGDMQVGDSVYGVDGYTHKVVGVFPQGVMKTYRVSFSDGTSTLCCGEHLWGVYDCADNERYSVLTLNNIIQNGLKTENDFRYRIPVCSPVMFNHSRVPVHAESLAEEMFQRGSNGGYSGSIPNEYIYTDYVSRLKFIAKVIQNRLIIDDETGLAYVVGVNSSVYDSLQTLVQSVGGLLYREKGEINCRIMLPESAINYISSIVGRNLHDISFPVKYITDVEEVGEKECQCIYIDSAEHLYLTDNFIVTHNSEIAVSVMLYLMYRLMCMKNPYQSYNLKVTEKFCFGFMNITKQLAEEIGVSKFQETVQMSPWFMSHGTITGRTNLIWNPPDFINIIIGSQSSDVIGQPIFACLGADTVVMTDKGARMICGLVGERIRVQTVDDDGNVKLSDECTVLKTKETQDYFKITLEDGTVVQCTPEHRFLMSDGSYKMACDLTPEDDLADFKPFGYVYKITNNITGKIYVEKREKPFLDCNYWGSGKHISNSIKKYGVENFSRDVLGWYCDKQSLCEAEQRFIKELNATDPSIGYNIADGGQGGSGKHSDEWKKAHSGSGNGRYGRPVSDDTRAKISKANKGKVRSQEVKDKMSASLTGKKKPEWFSQMVSNAQRGRKKTQDELEHLRQGAKTTAIKNKGKKIYNNGVREIRVHPNEDIPDGFVKGRLSKISQSMKQKSNLPSGYRWYNNGIQEKYCATCPDGFYRGRLKR